MKGLYGNIKKLRGQSHKKNSKVNFKSKYNSENKLKLIFVAKRYITIL